MICIKKLKGVNCLYQNLIQNPLTYKKKTDNIHLTKILLISMH
jgi:hypothetical protein